MLLGRSVFHSVVERLQAENAAAPEEAAPGFSHRVAGLNLSFAVSAAETDSTRHHRMTWAYSDIMEDQPGPEAAKAPEPPPEPVMPAHLGILDVSAIAAELDIGEATTIAELNEKRRRFARDNHPDRVHENFRGNATVRMTIANQLIDKALRQRQH